MPGLGCGWGGTAGPPQERGSPGLELRGDVLPKTENQESSADNDLVRETGGEAPGREGGSGAQVGATSPREKGRGGEGATTVPSFPCRLQLPTGPLPALCPLPGLPFLPHLPGPPAGKWAQGPKNPEEAGREPHRGAQGQDTGLRGSLPCLPHPRSPWRRRQGRACGKVGGQAESQLERPRGVPWTSYAPIQGVAVAWAPCDRRGARVGRALEVTRHHTAQRPASPSAACPCGWVPARPTSGRPSPSFLVLSLSVFCGNCFVRILSNVKTA